MTYNSEKLKPLPVHGYTEQDNWRLNLVNANKIFEEMILRQLDDHRKLPDDIDQRCLAIAHTKLQEAFMWLNRAVFRPTRLTGELPEPMVYSGVIQSVLIEREHEE